MKNFKKIFIFGLFVALFMTSNVNAEELVTSVGNSDELVACLTQKNATATCKLTGNILDLTSRVVIPEGTKITLDLNGKTLELPDVGYSYPLVAKGELTIDGNGTVNIKGEYGIQTGFVGTLTIKNGTYNQETGSYIVANYGTATIEGGTFNGDYCAVNSFEYNGTKYYATIKGGTFNTNEAEVILGYVIVEGGTYNQDISLIGPEEDSGLEWAITISEGYVLRKVENLYKVYKEHNVKVNTVTNGKVEAKGEYDEYVIGDTVTLTITPDAGYVLTSVTVLDANKEEVTYSKDDAKFVMPDSDVTIDAVFAKVETTVEIPVVDSSKPVEEVTVGVVENEETEEILTESLKENDELAELAEKQNVTVAIEIAPIEEEKVEDEVKNEIKEVDNKLIISEYFDISVLVKDTEDNQLLGTLSKLNKEIELTILLPENLKNADTKVTRTYYVIRRHVDENNKVTVEKLPATLSEDGNTLTFKTSEFSLYALAYGDVSNEEVSNPNTFDGITNTILVGMLSLVGLMGTGIYLNKKSKVNAN